MSFGIGNLGPVGYGEADSWGGPADGVDLVEQAAGELVGGDDYSGDRWLFVIIIGSLAILWILGAGVFRSARM